MNGILAMLGRNPIARNAGFLSVSAASRGLSNVALIILALRALGPSEGGQVILGFSIIRIAQAVAEGGLSRYLTREVARNPDAAGVYTLSAVKLILLLVAPVGLLSAAAAATVQPLLGAGIALGTLAALFGAIQQALSGTLLARDRTFYDSLAAMTLGVGQAGGSAAVAAFAASPLAFIAVIAGAHFLGAAVAGAAFLAALRPTVTPQDASAAKALSRSLPYLLNAVGSYVYLRMDILILAALAGTQAVAIYGGVAEPLVTLGTAAYILNASFLPKLSRAFGVEPSGFLRLARNMMGLNVAAGGALAVVAFFGAGEFVNRVLGGEFAPAADVLRVLSVVVALRFVNNGMATWLTAAGRQWHRTLLILGAAGLNIGLNLMAVPIWGYWGAVWSTLATEASLLGLFAWLLRSDIAIAVNRKRLEAYGLTTAESGNVVAEY